MTIEMDNKFRLKETVYKIDISGKIIEIKSYIINGVNLFIDSEGTPYITYSMEDYGIFIDEEELFKSYELAYAKYMEIRRTII